MEHDLPIVVIEITVLFQDILATETNMRRFVAVHSTDLVKNKVRIVGAEYGNNGERTVVFPGLS